MRPKISIIIPVKNACHWLDDCLHSIQNQDFQDWECIIINDHSDDQSLQAASTHSFFDHRFRIVHNNSHGLIHAYRTGLNAASGDYIARMDADDIMPHKRLQWMHDVLQHAPERTVVTGKVEFFPEENVGIGTEYYQNWLNERMDKNDHWDCIWRECVIPSPCWMARKEELNHIGRFEDLEYPEDYNLAFRFFEHGFQVHSIPEICHYWRQHDKRYSRTSDNYSAEKFTAIKWYFFQKLKMPEISKLYVLGNGDKAKLLQLELDRKQVQFTWLSHEENVAGNIYANQKILWLYECKFEPNSAVISTLSSIDNFDSVYAFLHENSIPIYRFC